MKISPKISVIIPVYNGEKYIKRCLESVFSQTYTNMEILVVNDGSSDNSLAIIEAAHEKSPFPVRILNGENHGVADARNKGIDFAEGDYIVFVDQDDYLDTDFCAIHARRSG